MKKPVNMTPVQVTNRTNWTDDLFSLSIKASGMSFQAGQFTKLGIPDSNGDLIKRAYSIVTHPNEYQKTGELEFLIVSNPDGQLSPLLNHLKIGDTVWLATNVAGTMTLSEIPIHTKDLWLISTGTGVGPFLSMLRDSAIMERFNHIILVHAARLSVDLSYRNEFELLEKQYPETFKYVPVISREQSAGMLYGRIPKLFESKELERKVELHITKENSFIYLCGNPSMIKDMTKSLKSFGFEKHLRLSPGQFSSEGYWY